MSGSRRLVIERLSEGAVTPHESGTITVDAPALHAIRLVFGVGKGPESAPDDQTFRAVYTVSIPVFSLGGLDSDGVFEFDVAALLGLLQSRATRRRWAMRLELELLQGAATVAAADIYIETPFSTEDGPTLAVAGRGGKGTVVAGGGRSVIVATSLAHDAAGALRLAGTYSVRLSDSDPRRSEAPRVASEVREIRLGLGRYEFEG